MGVGADVATGTGGSRSRVREATVRADRLHPDRSPRCRTCAHGAGGGRKRPVVVRDALRSGNDRAVANFAIHRSAYQLKEADPHTWAIPRLDGRAKAALVDIQIGEYGDGVAPQVHATLFGNAMRALGLDASYGMYLDRIPGVTLATVNLVSMLGLHRRWRGTLVGHLALFEMCSVVPMGRYAHAMRRLGAGHGSDFYDAHVVADTRHELVALHTMAGALAADEPGLASDIVIGARALAFVENAFAMHLLEAWSSGHSSLLAPAS